ncbi:MAG: paraquat-inducible protein A [Phycisphaerales bacterium]
MSATCDACGLEQRLPPLKRGERARCRRCSRRLWTPSDAPSWRDAHVPAALALAALVLLIPANTLPILELVYLGRVSSSTVWGGCIALWDEGMWAVATIVFAASIAIPFLKLGAIFLLAMFSGSGRFVAARAKTLVVLEAVGRWSMLDVFLLAVLVAVVKLDTLSSARPGPGLFFFAAVVVLTMLSSASFDTRVLWRELAEETR